MINTVINAIDTEVAKHIQSNILAYGLCREIEKETVSGGLERLLIADYGKLAVTDDAYDIGSLHIHTNTYSEYKNNAFDVAEKVEMKLLIYTLSGIYNTNDLWLLYRDIIYALEINDAAAKAIQLTAVKCNFQSTEIFRSNYSYFKNQRTKAIAPVNVEYLLIDYTINAQYSKGNLRCLQDNCLKRKETCN